MILRWLSKTSTPMVSTILSLLLTLVILHQQPLSAAANLQQTTALLRPLPDFEPTSLSADAPLTTYFEVTKPIPLPNTKPCSYLLLQHDFAFTYGQPPVLADYTTPSDCASQNFAKIVLEWTATCKGRQFDRIFGIWIGGVEILRSCTAEPRATGTIWTVKKDVTRYHSLFMSNQTLAVYLGNIVDSTYTGIYHVNISLHFYPAGESSYTTKAIDNGADLIMPISRNLPLKDGLWFEVQNSTHVESKKFKIPLNAYRAVLEVYVSFHENDEFWFGNPPNDYISANNLTGLPGNGPFREVVVSLDGSAVGAVWPFTVIFTGGVNPLLWRPITAIGSFDLPSYDIEITPFLGKLLDGEHHELAFRVTNALNVWYIDANLHLWLDSKSKRTQGKLLEHKASPLSLSLLSNFTGSDGVFVTNVTRSIISTGQVKSSHGVVTTTSLQMYGFSNTMVMGNDGNEQILNQVIISNTSVDMDVPLPSIRSANAYSTYSLDFHSDNIDKGNRSYDSVANLTLGFKEKVLRSTPSGVSTSKLRNMQSAQGSMFVKGNLVVTGEGSTQQELGYTSDKLCYFRNVSSSNYTILHDEVSNECRYDRCSPYFARRSFLGLACHGLKRVLF